MAASKEKMADQKEIALKFSKSISTTPSSGFSFEGGYSSPIEPCSQSSSHGLKLQSQQILQKHKYVVHEYNNCFVCLQEAFAEVNLLRQENLMLRDETIELLKLVTEKEKENEIMSLISGPNITPDFHQIDLNILGDTGRQVLEEQHLPRGDLNAGKRIGREMDSEENNLVNRVGVVPKIISIRSNGFLGMNNQLVNKPSSSRCSATGHETNRPFRLRLASNNPSQGCEDEEGIELEVYNQGMFKTELCNKWEQTKNCPYGDRCQFAHGIEELRPVIRHPRYKTEICRMISSGGTCPYGHRCHFRHALLPNEEEKEVVL